MMFLAACAGRSEGDGPARRSSEAPTEDAANGSAWLVDVAPQLGIDFEHDAGYRDRYLMPEMTTGGGGFVDFDGDGDLDVYLVQAGPLVDPPDRRPPNRLFRNDGDAGFVDVTEASGTGDRGYGQGLATGDYDGDGDVDLYVTNVGPDVLYRNEGDGRFTDVTDSAGLGDPGWGTSAAFADYDRDGDLDLFVVRYLVWSIETEVECRNDMRSVDYCSPQVYDAPATSLLYRNEGDGRFTDVSADAGLTIPGTGLGIVVADFTEDGWPDFFVANDGMPNRLWVSQQDGSLADEALLRGVAMDSGGTPKAGMGTAAADVDFDGDEDLIVCNLQRETDSFFLNHDGEYFTDHTVNAGIALSASKQHTRFGVGWVDLDNDGRLDLYQANGRVVARAGETLYTDDPYAEPNLVLRGQPDGSFTELSPADGTEAMLAYTARAAAFGDYDGDGGIDVLVVNRSGPAQLFRNTVPDRGNWIAFAVRDELGRDAYGARLRLEVEGRSRLFELRSSYSYLAANSPRVHVGLGMVDAVEDVTVTWPDGAIEAFGDFEGGRRILLERGAGQPISD